MADEINDDNVIERLALLIEGNELLYKSDVAPGLLREVIRGEPDGNELDRRTDGGNLPYCYVTTPTNNEVSREFFGDGTGVGEVPVEKVTIDYHVVISDQKKDTKEVIKSIRGFATEMKNMYRKNPKLKKPDGTDPIAYDLKVFNLERFEPLRGQDLESMTVLLQVSFLTNPS